MATRICIANGNLTAAATWATVNATALLNSQAGNTALTTSYVESQTFTPGNITIDGIAIKIASRAAGTPTNTITVRLAQGGADVAGTVVTINVSDILRDANSATSTTLPSGLGWYFFKFASPVTLAAATAYTVSVKLSATTTAVNLYRDATAGNWSRMLRTTTTGAPAAGDNLYILGEWTAATTKTNRTVTMNETATTSYGAAVSSESIGISNGGILTYGTTASTNYLLRCKGWFICWPGATFNIGTTGTPIPASSTAVLEFDCTADGDSGFECLGAIVNVQANANSRTCSWALLTADLAANGTSVTTLVSTGWRDNDEIVFTATSRTSTHSEQGSMNGNASGSTITFDGFTGTGGGVLNAHSGTSPTQGEVGNRTRNIKIRGVSSSLPGYFSCRWACTVDIDWAEFYNLGESATARQRGVNFNCVDGSTITFSHCSIHDTEDYGLYVELANGSVTYTCTIEDLFADNLSTVGSNSGITLSGGGSGTPTSGAFIMTDVLFTRQVQNGTNSNAFYANIVAKVSVNNLIVSGCTGFGILIDTAGGTGLLDVSFQNINSHSNSSNGFSVGGAQSINDRVAALLLNNIKIWRNGGVGLSITSGAAGELISLSNLTIFGNTTSNISISSPPAGIKLTDSTIAADSSFATTNGLSCSGSFAFFMQMINCTFGVTSGIFRPHTNDINGAVNGMRPFLSANSCVFASPTEINGFNVISEGSFISSDNHDQVAGAYKRWERYGIRQKVSITDHLGATVSAEELTPNSNSSITTPFESAVRRIAVASGATATPHVWVKQSAAYNGAQPKLYIRRNDALGITSDTLLDTGTVAVNNWEELTGTTIAVSQDGVLEFYITCNGTAGVVSITEWTI